MKKTIEFLQRDRQVNDTFMKKLEDIGLDVQYGKYSYWDHQEFVQIGRVRVFLVCEYQTDSGNTGLGYRYQNNVIEEILETLKTEKQRAEQADKLVNDFFQKLGLKEE